MDSVASMIRMVGPPEPRGDVTIEQFNHHEDCCDEEVCLQYDGTVWEQGIGPMPVLDTHEGCTCTRDVFEP